MATVDVDELRRLRASGTQGEWHAHLARWYSSVMVNSPDGPSEIASGELNKADASLICAAVNALPSLLDELARTRAELAAVRERLDSVKGFDMGDGWMICRSANPNTPGWLVSYTEEPGDEDSNVLFVDASGALIEDDLYAFADVLAAFAAIAAAQKETT